MPAGRKKYWVRVERVLERMRSEGLDLVLVYARGNRGMYSNLLYLTGYYDFDAALQGALLIHGDGRLQLVLDAEWDLDRAAQTSWIERGAMRAARDLAEGLAGQCKEWGLRTGRIGLVGDEYLPHALFRALEANLPGADLVPATPLVADQRLIKTPSEIDSLRIAADITRRAIVAGILSLQEGVSELETLAVCVRTMLENRAQDLAFAPVVSFGQMTEVCAAPASENILKRGDMVMFDMGCVFGHYAGDLTRVRVFGKPSAEQQAIWGVVRRAQEAGIRAVRPGASAAEVDGAARSVIVKAGYGKYFNHGLGHGQGLDHCEPPFIEPGNAMRLRPGMVFSIEPGVYVRGVGGARIEDTVVVTEDGSQVISVMDQGDLAVFQGG